VRHGSVIRAWTEAEIGAVIRATRQTDLLTQFTGVIVGRIGEVAPARSRSDDRQLVLVAMLERLNYYALTNQVPWRPTRYRRRSRA